MRRLGSLRVRITAVVTVLTGVFLGIVVAIVGGQLRLDVLGAVIDAEEPTNPALDPADESIDTVFGGVGDEFLGTIVRSSWERLAAAGRLPLVWEALGLPPPPDGAAIVVWSTDPTYEVQVTGASADATAGAPPVPSVRIRFEEWLAATGLVESGYTPDQLSREVSGEGITIIGVKSLVDAEDAVATAVRNLWLLAGALTVGVGVVTWVATGRTLRPVARMSRRVEEIRAAGAGDRIPEPGTGDEIDHLARTVNSMLARLDDAAIAQRRFVADASHELRSPLAVLRTEAEVALAHPATVETPRMATAVLNETVRLEGLVDDLLVLARADDPAPAHHLGALPLVDVEEIALTEAARARRLPVTVADVLAGRVRAHPIDVTRIVRHLLDNAARYGAATVALTVRRNGEQVILIVDDDGDGVPLAERERIFERFARTEASRARDAGGVGLGLAVVRATVQRLGGHIGVGDSPLGGARFIVQLPAAG
jgi:signal transduction histidine kinase